MIGDNFGLELLFNIGNSRKKFAKYLTKKVMEKEK